MLNLFRSKKESGKSPAKSSRRGQAPSNRTGSRTPNGESKSWFGSKPTKPAKSRDVQIKPISASSPALNNNNEGKKSARPLTIATDSNITLRRGQQPSKPETPTPEELSRSSSASNLNAEHKPKGARPKKADSKDRLDKTAADKKHDRGRALSKNNNRESDGDGAVDVDELQRQLAQMASDKSSLALQLGEQSGQLGKLQGEVTHLRMLQEEAAQKVDQLAEENTILRNRLRDVAHSPLSDNEKQQLLYEARHHSSAPASIATNLLDDGGDITSCPTPEWDKHSSSNVSEVSVACLQDKINQMQETHYSTNEELQATLQELTDLQRQLTELQQENVRLNEEKNLMFESLCRQTERLNDSRGEVESLKQLLYKDDSGQFETAAEREQKLVDLLKSAQEETETLLMKHEQLGNDLEESRSVNMHHSSEISQLSERVKTLESTLDAKHAEHKQLDQELAQAKDQSSGRQIEINRLKDLLENARTKINELEQDRALSDKSELDEMLDNARKEKDALESEVAHLKEKLALSKNENEKLKEQVSILQEECKVIRNNAKMTQSDLEYKLETVVNEKNATTEQLQQFQEAVNELQVQAQCQLDDKRQLSTVLSETQRNLNESERRVMDLENELVELKKTKQEQEEEWEKFQNDLLTSVRVANDFKTEAQQDLQKLIMENKASRERIKQLESQIDKLKGTSSPPKTQPSKSPLGGSKRKPSPRLSNEEMLMSSLDRRYKEIENLSDALLTEEQRAVKVLKRHYETEFPRQKPVAHKPKNELAISKPSLESVISNPKLGKIVKDEKLTNVEEGQRSLSPARISLIDAIGASVDDLNLQRIESFQKVQSDVGVTNKSDDDDVHRRSKSLSDLPTTLEKTSLRRYDSTDDLLTLSKDSKRVKKRKKSSVNFNTLESICSQIDPNTPEDQLTKEQRLALRLRDVLSKEEKKTTLKKRPNLGRKKPVISRPTQESVERNSKLYDILRDPVMKSVAAEDPKVTKRAKKQLKKTKDRYSVPLSYQWNQDTLKKSKSYNDITFKFQVPNMYSEEENKSDVDPVLPPEEFRDPAMEDSVFKNFQTNNNTFKKEHNYLDDDRVDNFDNDEQVKISDDQMRSDPDGDDNVAKTVVDKFDKDEQMKVSDEQMRPDTDSDDNVAETVVDNFDKDEQMKISEEDQDDDEQMRPDGGENVAETLNEAILRRLEYEDGFTYEELDEEVVAARRGTRQRYSHVIEEMKGKFEKSSDEEDYQDDQGVDKDSSGIDLDSVDSQKTTEKEREEYEELVVQIFDKDYVFNTPKVQKRDDDTDKKAKMSEDFDKDFYVPRAVEKSDYEEREKNDDEDLDRVVSIRMEDLQVFQDFDNDIETEERNTKTVEEENLPLIIIDDQDIKSGPRDLDKDSTYQKSDDSTKDKTKKFEETFDTFDDKATKKPKDFDKDVRKTDSFEEENLPQIIDIGTKQSKSQLSRSVDEDPHILDTNQDTESGSKDLDKYSKYQKYDDDDDDEATKKRTYFDKDPIETGSFKEENLPQIIVIESEETESQLSKSVDEDPHILDTDDRQARDLDRDSKYQTSEETFDVFDDQTTKKANDVRKTVPLKEEILPQIIVSQLSKNVDKDAHILDTEDKDIEREPRDLDKDSKYQKTEETFDTFDDKTTKKPKDFDKDPRKTGSLEEENLPQIIDIKGPHIIETEPRYLDKESDKDLNASKEKEESFDIYEETKEVDFNILERFPDKPDPLVKSKTHFDFLEDFGRVEDQPKPSPTKEDHFDFDETSPETNHDNHYLLNTQKTPEPIYEVIGQPHLTEEESQLVDHYSNRRISQPLSDINSEDLSLVDELRYRYLDFEENPHERHVFPQILAPRKLDTAPIYEPVYANVLGPSSTRSTLPPVVVNKKPVASPRVSFPDPDSTEAIYREFAGQVRKTRFSITYERKKGDSFKEKNEEKSARVSDLRAIFEGAKS
ncbi:uncharacterized protein LOC135140650 isoform X4 [Zophobas morio]|uniref:uncharacterized protein LOC135140650 isoform X4 n=1 Tax=Zophobas morio TaxID=2755281 RepID=UPI003082ACC7